MAGTTPPVTGIKLRGAKLLKIRKVRDAAPAADGTSHPVDLLRAHLAFAAMFGHGGMRL